MELKAKLSPEWKKQFIRLFWLLLIPLAFIIKFIGEKNPSFAEAYARFVFPAVGSAVSAFTGVFPFSLAEFIVYFIIAAVICFIIVQILRLLRHKFRLVEFVRGLITIGIIIGAMLCAFYLMWGLNYYRRTAADLIGLERSAHEPQELADMCVALASAANTLRERLPEDESGVFKLENGKRGVLAKIPAAYSELGKSYDIFSRSVPQPKPVLNSAALSAGGITGIFIPHTQEANVNIDAPDLLVASAAAHECAHQLGIAREDEANFISFLACLKSSDDEVKYSGIVMALIYAGNALNDISPDAYAKLYSYYGEGLKRDLDAHNTYWDKFEGETSRAVDRMNDNYLKNHSQSIGVMSYGKVTDLLLDYFAMLKKEGTLK